MITANYIVELRQRWEKAPAPWVGTPAQLHTLVFFESENYENLINYLPGDILLLLSTIEYLRADMPISRSREIKIEHIRLRMRNASLPWLVEPGPDAQTRIIDKNKFTVAICTPLHASNILRGLADLDTLIDELPDFDEMLSVDTIPCICLHAWSSHLFVSGTSACVERPCPCTCYSPMIS
jgi:hypothetical protein